MATTEVKTVPVNVAYCRGTQCHTPATCSHEGVCGYKSSAEEYREAKEAGYTPAPKDKAGVVRTFETGANRDVDTSKLDYEGFLSPLVLQRYAEYMHKNRFLRDGSMRDSDNWQKGMPRTVFMKSLWRHFMSVWTSHRRPCPTKLELSALETATQEDLCAVIFNASGYLHEILLGRSV